ncbi:cation channel sperm-associated auxiliary subunit beta [Eudromia elegans]
METPGTLGGGSWELQQPTVAPRRLQAPRAEELRLLAASLGNAHAEACPGNLSFSCFTNKVDDEKARFKAIKLYLDSQNLMISCYLYNVEGEDSLETRRKLLLRYNSAGLAPTVEIFNSTYSQIFYFTLIMQTDNTASTWNIDIPRENITYNTDIAPIEEWFLKFRMHHGLNMFTTEGTLLDILREPILQWELGERITAELLDTVLPYVINITLSASPCANDVAVIGLIGNASLSGVYIGVTYTGFAYDNTTWFNITKNLCQTDDDGKDGFRITDVEKTVVIPGSSSFLITAILDNETATAEPTMPKKVPFNISIPSSQWFMHNFGTANGKKWDLKGKSSIAVIIPEASCMCETSAFVITLKTGCLHGKSIHYISPVPVTTELWLQKTAKDDSGFPILKELPVNYRPPSIYGIAIPISNNFYNADPSKPRMRNYFTDSKVTGSYKKCANKSSRAECNCTLAERMSSLEIFSDCTEKALRMRYPVTKLPIHFKLKHSNSITNLTYPYFVTITEVNQRENWEVRGVNETSGILKIRFYLTQKLGTTVYHPSSLILSLYGSELFHFKVSTVPGVSHCNLSDEFQIYVDDAPLAFPGSFLISALTALFIGGVIFVAFLIQLYQINIWDEVKRKCGRFNKVSPSGTSSAAATSASKRK